MQQTTVYIYRDQADVVLYIGITHRGSMRMQEHTDKPWWAHVDNASFIHLEDRQTALDVEKYLIEVLNPLGNTHHRTGAPLNIPVPTSLIRELRGKTAEGSFRVACLVDPRAALAAVEDMRTRIHYYRNVLTSDQRKVVGCVECLQPWQFGSGWRGPRCPSCYQRLKSARVPA